MNTHTPIKFIDAKVGATERYKTGLKNANWPCLVGLNSLSTFIITYSEIHQQVQ
jgi:hypothetical protein